MVASIENALMSDDGIHSILARISDPVHPKIYNNLLMKVQLFDDDQENQVTIIT